jgi:hypothetical protein
MGLSRFALYCNGFLAAVTLTLTAPACRAETGSLALTLNTADIAITATGSTLNLVSGDVAGDSLTLSAGTGLANNLKTLTMQFDLTNYSDPILTFATRGSGPGFTANKVTYSTDGSSFFLAGTYAPTDPYAVQTFDLSSVNALDGAPTAFIRITFSGATQSIGVNRIDNIQLNATTAAVPEANAFLMGGLICGVVGLAYGGQKLRRRRSSEQGAWSGESEG